METELKKDLVIHIKKWIGLLETRLNDAEKMFASKEYAELYGNNIHARNIHLARSLRNFLRISVFLVEKIDGDESNAQMYLCQLRTVADILSRVVYLLSLDEEAACRVSLCEDSIGLKKIDEDIFASQYNSLILNNPIFIKIKNFPSMDNISRKRFEKIEREQGVKLLFPSFENRLNNDYIKSKTFDIASKLNVSLFEGLKNAHKSFSYHVHGQHYFNRPQGNELFWLCVYLLTFISYTCEIIDKEIFHKNKAADIRILITESSVLKERIKSNWPEKR